MYRAEFDTSRTASLLLTNEDLGYEKINHNPIETNSDSNTTADSTLFKNNNSVVKVNHSDNGFDSDGNSYVFFKGALDIGGVTATQLNSGLFKVTNSGIDHYNITSSNRASSNSYGGGTNVLASYNRKFEKIHAIIPNLSFSQTTINSYVKTTNISPVDDNVSTFASYSQSDYEKTFLNEDFFFINQKVLASRINESSNNIDRSLTYKVDLSSSVSHLSPLIDLSRSSIKTISNKVENASGKEDRFGRREQLLEFYPIYKFTVVYDASIPGSTLIQEGTSTNPQKITGVTTGAIGDIIDVTDKNLTV